MPVASVQIEQLPCELLLTIFEYLNLSDRKVASLVNHRWFNLINQLNYTQNNFDLVIRNVNLTNDHQLLQTLDKSTMKIRTVSFVDDVIFDSGTNKLLNLLGDTVTDVKFVHCSNLNNNVLIDLFTKCRNLKNLQLYAPCFSHWNLFRKNNVLITESNFLNVKTCLESITHLTICDSSINDIHFKNLLYSLPNLTSLNTTSLYFQRMDNNADERRYLSRRCLVHWIESKGNKLTELYIKYVDDDLLMDLSRIKNLKLKILHLQLESVEQNSLEKFLTVQRGLTYLSIGFSVKCRPRKILLYLETFPCLKEIKMDVGLDVGGFSAVYNLKYLEVSKKLFKIVSLN